VSPPFIKYWFTGCLALVTELVNIMQKNRLLMFSELPVDCLKSPMPVHVTETHLAPIVKTKVTLRTFYVAAIIG